MGRRSDVLIEFVERHRILSTALRGFGGSSHRDDLRQAALVGVWTVLQASHDPDTLPATATRAARFRVLDEWRRLHGYRSRGEFVTLDGALEIDDGGRSAGELDARLDYAAAIEERLVSLAPRFRLVVRPYFFDGLTARECADRHGLSESYVCRLIRSTRVPMSAGRRHVPKTLSA